MITINQRERIEWTPGMTVRDVLERMNYTYPEVVIRVNGEVVMDAAYDSYHVPDEADVRIIHLMAGG
ncbi:MAG: sulfur carrier protein ThiS [Anaerolineales bacterium]